MSLKSRRLGKGRWVLGDCLEALKRLPDNCIDMVLCDLPYGTTELKWDKVLPLDILWQEYIRICKGPAAIVLTANQPFTSKLIMSNLPMFKYTWIWEKNKVTGFALAKCRPLKVYEDICVFSKYAAAYHPKIKNIMNYYPQGLTSINKTCKNTKGKYKSSLLSPRPSLKAEYKQTQTGYPKNVLKYDCHHKGFHPTQKPVPLFEYLIKTYTKENDIVLDNCAGSGTTAIAAINTKRRWLCIEKDKEYSNKALNRIREHLKDANI